MPEPFSIAKTVIGFFGSVFSFISKRYAQPKIECSWQRSNRTNGDIPSMVDGHFTMDMDYQYEMRFTNNSEHPAYHMKLVSCDVQTIRNTIDYNLPIPAHESKTYYIDVRRQFISPKKGLNPDIPTAQPITELRIEYSNGKGKRFFTVYKPKDEIEARNKFGRV